MRNLTKAADIGEQLARRTAVLRAALAHGAPEATVLGNRAFVRPALGRLTSGFGAISTLYQDEWHSYLSGLAPAPAALTGDLVTQYNVALMTVKAHEDKTYRGAFIASLTLPWGFAVNADEGGGGYHFVWARDLYH